MSSGPTGPLPDPPLIGGRFTLDEALPPGPRSAVRLGRDVLTAQAVVVRLTPLEQLPPDHVEQLRADARLLRRAGLAGLAPVRAVGHDRRTAWLVHDFVPGISLRRFLADGPLAPAAALRLGQRLLATLDGLHQLGLQHRNLRPGNVIVPPTGLAEAVLVDFGTVRLARPAESAPLPVEELRYQSPEQVGLLRREVDHRADLYAAGAVLYETLAGRPPYHSADPTRLLRALLEAPPPLRRRGVAVPRALDAILDRLLRRDPAARYQSAAAAAADLSALAVALAEGAVDPPLTIGRSDLRRTLTAPDLVGRRPQRTAVAQALARAAAGEGGIVRLTGPAGSGRSRLLAEVEDAARGQGAAVIALPPAADARPGQGLETLAQALAAALQAGPAAPLSEPQAAALLGLRGRFRAIADAFPGPTAEPPLRDDAALSALLTLAGAPARPALITQDDAHRLDATSLAAFGAWQRSPATRRYALVLLAAPDSPQAEAALSRIQGARIPLPALSAAELHRLAESMAGPLPAEAHARLVSMSGGNPAAAEASLQALVESGTLVAEAQGWRLAQADPGAGISAGVRALAEQALERLPPDAARWLCAAAVLGQRFDQGAVAEVADLDLEAAQAAAQAAARAHLIWREGGRAAFVHDAIRLALLEQLDEAQGAALHDRAAARLLRRPGADPAALARHLAAAGRPAEAGPPALIAAQAARNRGSTHELTELLCIAEAALAADDPHRLPLVAELGAGLTALGRYPEAERCLAEAAACARTPRERATSLALQAQLAFRRGEPQRALELTEAGLRLIGHPIPKGRVATLGALTGALTRQLSHALAPRLLVGLRGLEHAASDGLAAELLRLRGIASYTTGGPNPGTVLAHLRRLNLSERYPPSEALAHAWSDHGLLFHELFGPGDLARRYVRRALNVARGLREPALEAKAAWYQALIDFDAGALDAAAQGFETALPKLRQSGDHWDAQRARHAQLLLWVARGALGEALADAQALDARALSDQRPLEGLLALEIKAICLDGHLDDGALQRTRRDPDDPLARLAGRSAEARILCARGQTERALGVLEDTLTAAQSAGMLDTWNGRPLLILHLTVLRQACEECSPYDRLRQDQLRHRLDTALRRAARILKRLPRYLSALARERGLAAALAGDTRLARASLDEAVARARAAGLLLDHIAALEAWARVGRALGWPRAEQRADEATRLSRRVRPQPHHPTDEDATPSMADRFASVVRMGRAIASSLTELELHRALREGALRVLRASRCLLFTVDGAALTGLDAPLSAIDHEAVQACVSRGQSVCVDHPQTQTREAHSVLCTPVLARGQLVRVIYTEQRGLTGYFGRQEIRLAEFLATLAGAALENTAGFEAVRALSRSLEERTVELTARNEELITTKEELEAFSYSVAHDLRGGLVAIHGYGSALAEDFADRLDALGTTYLERLRANALRLDRLTEALMMLSGISRSELQRVPIDLSALATQIIQDLDERLSHRVRWHVESGLAAEADLELSRIALHNLLHNAAKYSAGADPPEVHLEAAGPGRFRIRDNGVGFDPQARRRLFKPFQRLHGDAFDGTGVGLVTVQRIVRRHGGQIEADGRPNGGACFTFSLGPCAGAPPA